MERDGQRDDWGVTRYSEFKIASGVGSAVRTRLIDARDRAVRTADPTRLGAGSKYDQALSWAEANCAAEDDGYRGFDFNTDLDGVWFEGTAHMALAYRVVGNDLKAEDYLQELRRAQSSAEDGDGLGLLAASRDGLTTGFGTTYARRLHIGATSWLVFAELNYNPYWGAK